MKKIVLLLFLAWAYSILEPARATFDQDIDSGKTEAINYGSWRPWNK